VKRAGEIDLERVADAAHVGERAVAIGEAGLIGDGAAIVKLEMEESLSRIQIGGEKRVGLGAISKGTNFGGRHLVVARDLIHDQYNIGIERRRVSKRIALTQTLAHSASLQRSELEPRAVWTKGNFFIALLIDA
jgi:hypothetical protein